MNNFASVIEQVRQAAGQHVDPAILGKIIPVALVFLVAGFLISTLGAKFARFGVTSLFALFGAVVGYRFGVAGSFQPVLCAAIGGAMFGLISFLTFRLWVGVVTGLIFASVALGGFGYQRVLPHALSFSPGPISASHDVNHAPYIPTVEQQNAYLNRDPGQYVSELRSFVRERDQRAEVDGGLLGIATFLSGILLGVLAVRWMLILSTALLGTILVSSGLLTLLVQYVPSAYQAIAKNPAIAGIAVSAFFVSSLLVQFMLTRKSPPAEAS